MDGFCVVFLEGGRVCMSGWDGMGWVGGGCVDGKIGVVGCGFWTR